MSIFINFLPSITEPSIYSNEFFGLKEYESFIRNNGLYSHTERRIHPELCVKFLEASKKPEYETMLDALYIKILEEHPDYEEFTFDYYDVFTKILKDLGAYSPVENFSNEDAIVIANETKKFFEKESVKEKGYMNAREVINIERIIISEWFLKTQVTESDK